MLSNRYPVTPTIGGRLDVLNRWGQALNFERTQVDMNYGGRSLDDNSFYGAPAGWYPDPLGLPQLRWWDSTAWTHQTAEARAPMVMQETTYAWPEDDLNNDESGQFAADDDSLTRRERRERERRDGNDVPAPTAMTLLQLEPPGSSDMQRDVPQPAPFNPFAAQAAQTPQQTHAPETTESWNTPDPMAAARAASLQDQTSESFPATSASDQFTGTSYAQPAPPSAPAEEAVFSGFAAQPSHQNFEAQQQTFDWAPAADPLLDPQYQAYLKAQTAPHTKATHNGAVWMIALIPLIQLVLSLLVVTGFGTSDISAIMIAIWLAPYPIVIGLAAYDRYQLKKTGHEVTAHWVWALFTAPIYLIVRAIAAIRESGGGFGPVLVWFALGLLQIGAIVAVPGLVIATIPAVFAGQAEQSIVSDAAIIGSSLDVTCPTTPPLLVGQSFECSGQPAGDEPPYDIVVSLERVNGWVDWHVDDWGIYTLG